MHALRLGMAASFERKLGRRPLELDDPSDVICRTFAIKFFLTRPLRMVPAGVFAHRALQIGPEILSTRSTTRATRKFLVRYLSLPPTPPARPAHHTSRADRFHTLRPPHRLAHVQTSRRTRLGAEKYGVTLLPCKKTLVTLRLPSDEASSATRGSCRLQGLKS